MTQKDINKIAHPLERTNIKKKILVREIDMNQSTEGDTQTTQKDVTNIPCALERISKKKKILAREIKTWFIVLQPAKFTEEDIETYDQASLNQIKK